MLLGIVSYRDALLGIKGAGAAVCVAACAKQQQPIVYTIDHPFVRLRCLLFDRMKHLKQAQVRHGESEGHLRRVKGEGDEDRVAAAEDVLADDLLRLAILHNAIERTRGEISMM